MDTQNTSRQLRYLEEVRTPLHRAGFGTLPVEGEQLPVHWNGTPLCRITGTGSVFYRREDVDTPQAEDALYRVEDIAAKTLEYMTAMEAAPQLKASGLDGDYRILADFGGTVLAGSPSKYGVQFVTWDWDYDRTGVVHGHYFMENYDGAKQDFATRSGLIQKEQLFSPEQLTEIYRCCTDSVNEDFFELTDAGPLHPLHRCVWRKRHGDHVPPHPARLHGGLQRLQRQSHQPVLLREEPPHGTAGGVGIPAAEHAG